MEIRVAHLYPAYLNIYADRGNIAVFERRAAARGHQLVVTPVTLGSPPIDGSYDLFYVGGGQDREQAMIAPDLAERGKAIRAAVDGGAADWRFAVATSSSDAATGAATAPGCPARRSSRTRRSQGSSG